MRGFLSRFSKLYIEKGCISCHSRMQFPNELTEIDFLISLNHVATGIWYGTILEVREQKVILIGMFSQPSLFMHILTLNFLSLDYSNMSACYLLVPLLDPYIPAT